MIPKIKSYDFTGKSSRARKLIHLGNNTDASIIDQNLDDDEENQESYIVCEQIADEIYQNELMTVEHMSFILQNPELIPVLKYILSKSDDAFKLEKEYEMIVACLNEITQIPETIDLFYILLPKCKSNTVKNLILEACLKNIENPNYYKLFELYTNEYPSEDMWPWILKMNDGDEKLTMHLLFKNKFPKDKKVIIDKIRTTPTNEDMIILRFLQLTRDEFIQEDIFQLVINSLQSSLLIITTEEDTKLINTEEAKIRDALVFIGHQMIELNIFDQGLIDFAIHLFEIGDLYLVQQSANFLYNILKEPNFNIPIESISSMIQPVSIEKILDLIDSDSTSTIVGSSINLILIFLEKCPDDILPLLDFDYLSELLKSIADDTDIFNNEIEKIFRFFQTNEDEEFIEN